MQINIDDDYLDKLGVIKNSEYREYMGSRILQLLNKRMAIKITEILSDDQLQIVTDLPEDQIMSWLESNVPDFENIVNEELQQIIVDVQAVMPK